MKRCIFLLLIVGLLNSKMTVAQLDSLLAPLMDTVISGYDEAGLISFYPDTVRYGDFYTIYEQLFGPDPHNTMELQEHRIDAQDNLEHFTYQQFHDSIPVQGAMISEHGDTNGYVIWMRGKVATGLTTPSSWMNAESALQKILEKYPEHQFAWENEYWEEHLQNLTGDSTATYYPEGALVFGLGDANNLDYLISGSRYRLAWEFEVVCLEPVQFHKIFMVDAVTGEIFREGSMIWTVSQGPEMKVSKAAFKIFPNPVSDELHLSFNGRSERTVELLTSTGKVVLSELVTGNKNQLDVSMLGSGVYFLRVESEEQTYATKLIKW